MRLILALLYILSNSVLAKDNEVANFRANAQRLKELNEIAFACYKTQAVDTVTLAEKTDSYQVIKSKKSVYRVELSQKWQSSIFKVFKNGVHLIDFNLGDYDLNFRTGNIPLNTVSEDLKSIECYAGAKTYFINYNDSRNFVIHNHVQARYYGYSEGFRNWYYRFANGFRNYPNIVLLDGPSIGSTYQINLDQLRGNNAPNRKADLLTGNLSLSSYKVAPSGNLHITFGKLFTGTVTIMGTAYNYCTTNLFISLGRALISSEKTSLEVNLPGYYNHYQKMGVTKDLDINYPTRFNDIKTFIKEVPEAFSQFFEKQKKHVESELKSEVEILLKGQKPKTKRPKLILNII